MIGHVWHMTDFGAHNTLFIIIIEFYELNLIDIKMPNMNGYELLDVIRSNIKTQLIPVILLSAENDEDSKIKGNLIF